MDESNSLATRAPGLSRGWSITFLALGSLMGLDGLYALVVGGIGLSELVESIGQAIAGPLLALHGAAGLRNGRGLEGAGVNALAALGACLYLGGMVAGSAWWAATFG